MGIALSSQSTEDPAPTLATPNTPRTPATAIGLVFRELWRYKLVIPAVALLVAGGVAFWAIRQPKVYEATATLEYDPNPSRPLGSAVEDTTAAGSMYWDTQEFYETQNFILRSRSLAERVVRKLHLDRDVSFIGNSTSSVEATANRLMKVMRVEQVRDTRVVRVSIADSSPDRAQLIANTVVEAYIDKSLEDRLSTSGRAMEWLGSQMQNLKRELESSELALYRFREEHHAVSASLEERQKIIANQLQSYSNALTTIHSQRVQTESKLEVLKELLASGPDLIALHAGPITSDPAIADLRDRYRAASELFGRLSVTYGEAHPEVRAASLVRESLLAQLRAQVDAIQRGIESDLREQELAAKGIQGALDRVNQQGLELSLQEIDYSRLERERHSKTELYDLVMEKAAQTDLTRALRVANARIIDAAVRPSIPVRPRVKLLVAAGIVVGLALGIAAALGISFLDNKVRGPADMEARGVTVIGVLPSLGPVTTMPSYGRDKRRRGRRFEHQDRDLIVHLEPRSTAAECCRTIRTNITFQSADRPLRCIAVTSAMPKDGKTTVSISIATALAQGGRRVLIIDTDLRKPRLHRAFKLSTSVGITSVLAGEATLDEVQTVSDIPGLTVIPCGPIPPNPSELLHTRRFSEIIDEARGKFDTVIFDSPPLGAVTDPAVISTQVDGTIVVVRSGVTTRNGVDAALRQLQGVSARIIGVVLNGVDLTDSNYGSYYAYYRGYYEEDAPTNTPPASGAARAS